MKNPTTDKKLSVIARAPFNVYYEGEADVVSATNKVGPFDILPGHADFFSMLQAGEIKIDPGSGDPIVFMAKNGIVAVRDDEVMIFVNM
jgi:F-type H+-transporting ATPase subunit epsilon